MKVSNCSSSVFMTRNQLYGFHSYGKGALLGHSLCGPPRIGRQFIDSSLACWITFFNQHYEDFCTGAVYRGIGEPQYRCHDKTVVVTHCGRLCLYRKKIETRNLGRSGGGAKLQERRSAAKAVTWMAPLCPMESVAPVPDIGNAAHYVAVPPDRDTEPVRTFACFTQDVRALADWLKQCGIDCCKSIPPPGSPGGTPGPNARSATRNRKSWGPRCVCSTAGRSRSGRCRARPRSGGGERPV